MRPAARHKCIAAMRTVSAESASTFVSAASDRHELGFVAAHCEVEFVSPCIYNGNDESVRI